MIFSDNVRLYRQGRFYAHQVTDNNIILKHKRFFNTFVYMKKTFPCSTCKYMLWNYEHTSYLVTKLHIYTYFQSTTTKLRVINLCTLYALQILHLSCLEIQDTFLLQVLISSGYPFRISLKYQFPLKKTLSKPNGHNKSHGVDFPRKSLVQLPFPNPILKAKSLLVQLQRDSIWRKSF